MYLMLLEMTRRGIRAADGQQNKHLFAPQRGEAQCLSPFILTLELEWQARMYMIAGKAIE